VRNEYGNYVLSLDFQQLKNTCHVEEFYEMLTEKPKLALLCMSVAVHTVCLKSLLLFYKYVHLLRLTKVFYDLKQVLLSKWESDKPELAAKVDIRLHNCPETMIALKNLKAAYIGIP
jgi:DNA helicase MCM8